MSRTPFSSEEKDPTCVVKMVESLTRRNQRVGLNLGFGLGLSGNSGCSRPTSLGVGLGLGLSLGNRSKPRRGAAVATRLQFDESINIGRHKESTSRKRFMDTEGECLPGVGLGLRASVEKKFKFENSNTEPSNAIVPASPWDLRLLKADLLNARSKIEVLKNCNEKLHALKREQDIMFEHEKVMSQMQHTEDANKIEALESRVESLKKQRYECKEEVEELKAKLNSFNNDFGANSRALEKKVAELTDKLREAELVAHANALADKQQEAELEIKLASALEVAALHEQQVSELTTKLQDARQEKTVVELLNLQLQEAQLKIKSLESEKEDTKEAVALAISQKQKLLRFSEIERDLSKLLDDNTRLRGLVQNKLFLEEKVSNLETRLATTEERDKEFASLQAKLTCLEASHNEWLALAKDLGSSARNPSSLRVRFEHLQQRELQLTADSAELKSRLKAALESKSSTVAELESFKAQFEKQKVMNDQQTNFLHRQRKKLILTTQDRDYYRTQLDAYEKELTISINTALPTSQQEQHRSRISLLEKALQGYHELVEKLESDNAKEKKIAGLPEPTGKDRVHALEEENATLKQENGELKHKQEELQLELQYRALQGDFNPTKTKILHFRNNPKSEAESKREDELFLLRAECKKLQERVRVLSDGHITDVTMVVEDNVKTTTSREVQGLQEQVSNCQVKIQRLKEAFKKTSNEFREIVYQVLGYRIDWKNTSKYHLSSMYAESPDDILVFQYDSESGNVNMLETPFSKTLKSLMDLHLRIQKSIPVFLSAVTLDLFSQTTVSTATTSISRVE